jgi:stage II sporulation protein D
MSFTRAAARLGGLVKGSFRGIRVLRRGHSPRVVTAEVLGSRGTTRVSGVTLVARLRLNDSWAYFSGGASVDVSGAQTTDVPAPTPTTIPRATAGGTAVPSGSPAAPAASGGGAATGGTPAPG